MGKQEDAYIIEQVKQGNTAAFAALVERYNQRAYTVCVRIVGNHADAEEICQEGFLKAYHSLPDFRYESGFATWLFRIMFNTAISFLRKKKVKTSAYDEALPHQLIDNEWEHRDQSEAIEWKKRMIREAIQALDETDRAIVTLYYTFEQSIHEIARITELSESNVKVRLHRIRIKLQDEIKTRMNVHSLI
jgi:RNA polymerase sigma-70 factor, ECF subfamily